jgi:hypothetical protein
MQKWPILCGTDQPSGSQSSCRLWSTDHLAQALKLQYCRKYRRETYRVLHLLTFSHKPPVALITKLPIYYYYNNCTDTAQLKGRRSIRQRPSAQTGFVAPAILSHGYHGPYSRGAVSGPGCWLLQMSRLKCMEPYFCSPIRLHTGCLITHRNIPEDVTLQSYPIFTTRKKTIGVKITVFFFILVDAFTTQYQTIYQGRRLTSPTNNTLT